MNGFGELKPVRLFIAGLALGLGVAAAGGAAPADVPRPDRAVVYKKIGDVELKLHVFNPPGHAPTNRAPAIVFFFGGGWNGGTPEQFHRHARHYAERGLVAFSADYRVKNRQGTSPRECVKDGKSAIRWVRAHAAELGIDPQRIAAGGGSAGGHVAAAAGTVPGLEEEGEDLRISSRPDALVLFNPVIDTGPGGYGHDRVRNYWQDLSPLHHLGTNTPPTILFLGTKDHVTPVATAERYKQRMTEAGRRCDLHLYAGQAHGFFNYGKPFYAVTLREADRFLAELGYLKVEDETPKDRD